MTDANTQETPIPDYPPDMTFEQVWRIVQETALLQKKTERQMEKVTRELGRLGNSIGEVVETLLAARLWEKFSPYNYDFKRAFRRVMVYDDITHRSLTEIDILLSDTKWVMAVEVKHEVKPSDVERHLKRMEVIQKNPPAEARGKKLLGAVAGGTVNPEARELAHEIGFFVLELRGESVDLLPPPDGFSAREWSGVVTDGQNPQLQ